MSDPVTRYDIRAVALATIDQAISNLESARKVIMLHDDFCSDEITNCLANLVTGDLCSAQDKINEVGRLASRL